MPLGRRGSGAEAQHLRGTLAAIEDGVLTVVNEDEEEVQVALTADTGIYLVIGRPSSPTSRPASSSA